MNFDSFTFRETISREKWFLLFLVILLAVIYSKIFEGMLYDWNNDPNYSHGFLVPLISVYFVFERRQELNHSFISPSNWGLPIILFSLLLLIVGTAGTEYFTQRSSFVFLVAGIVIFLLGRRVFQILALPIGFLLFMVPLPYILYDALAFPLKLLVAKVSVASLKAMSIIVLREGNIIMFPDLTLEVADACSGLRSLVSLLALAVAFAFMTQKTAGKRLILIVMALPIAIVTNMFRVIMTGVLARYYGASAAEGFFHEFAGLAVFGLAMLLLILFGALLRRVGR